MIMLAATAMGLLGIAAAYYVYVTNPDLPERLAGRWRGLYEASLNKWYVDELYDHEARLFLILYSLKGDGEVDYITGRMVQDYSRSNYGNPVYNTESYPLFYWWNHTMWNDPEQDGVNGNERVYQENVEFDRSRYKPCLFNGQAC